MSPRGNEYTGNLDPLAKVAENLDVFDNWVSGKIGEYRFDAKIFAQGSSYGIPEASRISKLAVFKGQKLVLSYDRGWDVRPDKKHTPVYKKIIKAVQDA